VDGPVKSLLSKLDYLEPRFLPLGQIVSDNAQRYPDAIAMTQGTRETSWATFERATNQIANGFLAEGVRPGARIAYLGKTTDLAFLIMHACAKARAVFTPINWRLSGPEVAYVLEDAQAVILFVDKALSPLLLNGRESGGVPEILIDLEGGDSDDESDFSNWRSRFSAHAPGIDICNEDIVLQLYTSGTTGRPKGALISQEYVMNVGRMWHAEQEDIYDMLPGEEHLNFYPIFHTSGAISGHYNTFARGCGIVIFPDFDLEQILDCIDRRAIPLLGGVPTMLQMFLSHPRFQQLDFSNTRYVMYGAAPMPAPLRNSLIELVGCRFCQGYGATECLNISVLRPQDHETESGRLESVGRPMAGVDVRIVDAKGETLPIGTIGEIAIRAPAMVTSYWNLPEASAAAFRDGWYLTGDGGCIDEDGYLYLKERIKDLIISGGENIYPAEIENLLYAQPSVQSAAVVALADDKWGEVPVAFIVTEKGHEFDPEALRYCVAEHLARYKQPKHYWQLEALPLSGSGKVLKKDLRALALALLDDE